MLINKLQRGFTLVESLLLILVVAVIGFGGYYVWHTYHNAKPVAPTNSSVAKTSTEPATSQPASTQKYLTITEWGVRAPYDGSLSLEYGILTSNGEQTASFSSAQLDSSDSQCKVDLSQEGGYGGVISRFKQTDTVSLDPGSSESVNQYISSASPTFKQIGDYFYIFIHPQAACSSSSSSQDTEDQTISAVMSLVQNLQSVPAQ